MELLAKIVNDWKTLLIFSQKSSILDVWQCSECASKILLLKIKFRYRITAE